MIKQGRCRLKGCGKLFPRTAPNQGYCCEEHRVTANRAASARASRKWHAKHPEKHADYQRAYRKRKREERERQKRGG